MSRSTLMYMQRVVSSMTSLRINVGSPTQHT
jgi:hypothetical protein